MEPRRQDMNATTIRRPKALLLDDDANALRVLGNALEARGFEVLAATDAASGIDLLLEELLDLDVLVADAELPGRDAVSLVHLIRHAGGERELGLVVVGGGEPGLREQLLALGADAVVDRASGHEAVAATVAGVAAAASRRALPAARPAPVHPAVRGALVVVRAALAPAPRLAGVPA